MKQSYEQIEENNGTLTLEQLDDVAGGLFFDEYKSRNPQFKLKSPYGLNKHNERMRIKNALITMVAGVLCCASIAGTIFLVPNTYN